jgi:signal transduction histidine kinase
LTTSAAAPEPPSVPTRLRRVRARLPLAPKLALIMTALVAAGVAGLLLAVRGTLVDGAEEVSRAKLTRVVRDLAQRAEQASRPRVEKLKGAARRPVVQQALRSGDRAAIASAVRYLDSLALTAPDTSALELWDPAGRPLATIGGTITPALRDEALPVDMGSDAVWNGMLRRTSRGVHLWTLVPVDADGRRLGYLARITWLRASRTLPEQLRTLTGEEVAVYVRNADGSGWSTLSGDSVAAPEWRDSTSAGLSFWRKGERYVASEATVNPTPWVMVLETPERAILDGPRRTMQRLAVLGLLLVASGAVIAWQIGRRLARPLAALTSAAQDVARGTYQHAVPKGGGNEIEHLALTFSAMARQVAAAQAELERRAADSQEHAAELSRANARLEDAIATAEGASRAKSDFLAVMSHELRTPLNAISGYTELLSMGIYGDVTDAQQEALARVARSQRHLLSLIDDVLGFARLESGQTRFDITDVALVDTLSGVETIAGVQAQARGITLELVPCPPSLLVRADADKLRQVLLNLVTNAIKFTPSGGRIRVSFEGAEREVHVRVADTGPGIAPERMDAIFEPFVQGDRALNRPSEGVGLGLAISRDLARGMGGTLSVASTLGEGAVFTLTLPRAVPSAHPGATGSPTLAAATAAPGRES